MSTHGRQQVLAALIVRIYGQYNVKFYNLYFVEEGILLSYQGDSFRNFFLRWDIVLGRIRESVDVDIVLDAFEENTLIPYHQVESIRCSKPNWMKFGKVLITRTDGTKERYTLGQENKTKNPLFGHLVDNLDCVEQLCTPGGRTVSLKVRGEELVQA